MTDTQCRSLARRRAPGPQVLRPRTENSGLRGSSVPVEVEVEERVLPGAQIPGQADGLRSQRSGGTQAVGGSGVPAVRVQEQNSPKRP